MTETTSIPAGFSPAEGFLEGRTILITGASGGLGQALVTACARHGAVVILAASKVPTLERLYDRVVAAAYPEPVIYPVDFRGASSVDFATMAEAIEEQFSVLDGVIHCAAEFAGLTPLAQTDPAGWAAALKVNLTAPFLINQAVLSLLQRSDRARIVFTLDDRSRVAGAYWGAYGVSKWGLSALALICAEELEAFGIEVNAIVPPPLATRLRQQAYPGERGASLTVPDAVTAAYLYLLASHPRLLSGRVFCVPAAPSSGA